MIVDYKNCRYTLLTNQRIELLNEFKNINNNINEINYEYECKEPSTLVKEFLLDLIELYEDCCSTKNKLNLKVFYNRFKKILSNKEYNLVEKFYSNSNFGNMNYNFSLLFSDLLKYFDVSLFYNIFEKTIKNKKNY